MSKASIDSLMKRLPEYSSEEVTGGFIQGRALTRSKDAIHVATAYGILEVPVATILHVKVRDDDPTIVALQIADPYAVRVVLPVRMPGFPESFGSGKEFPRVRLPGSNGWVMPGALAGLGSTMTDTGGEDTATTCEQFGPDATDDHRHGSSHDDPPPGMGW